jgi:hypothetical protein
MPVREKALAVALVTACAGLSGPALAHHSFAMFDATKPMTLTVTVKEFEWTNPHSWLRVIVQDPASGKAMEWALELGSPAQQTSVGWKPDTVKPGDKVTVTFNPLKDGSRGGGLTSATLSDGRTLGNGGLRPNAQRSSKFPGGKPAGISED